MALADGYDADDEKDYPFFRSMDSYDRSKKEFKAITEIKDYKIDKRNNKGQVFNFNIKGPYTIKWKKINERFWYYLLEAK